MVRRSSHSGHSRKFRIAPVLYSRLSYVEHQSLWPVVHKILALIIPARITTPHRVALRDGAMGQAELRLNNFLGSLYAQNEQVLLSPWMDQHRVYCVIRDCDEITLMFAPVFENVPKAIDMG
jgi:hypothetical protein